jgi:hypothetical protein
MVPASVPCNDVGAADALRDCHYTPDTATAHTHVSRKYRGALGDRLLHKLIPSDKPHIPTLRKPPSMFSPGVILRVPVSKPAITMEAPHMVTCTCNTHRCGVISLSQSRRIQMRVPMCVAFRSYRHGRTQPGQVAGASGSCWVASPCMFVTEILLLSIWDALGRDGSGSPVQTCRPV